MTTAENDLPTLANVPRCIIDALPEFHQSEAFKWFDHQDLEKTLDRSWEYLVLFGQYLREAVSSKGTDDQSVRDALSLLEALARSSDQDLIDCIPDSVFEVIDAEEDEAVYQAIVCQFGPKTQELWDRWTPLLSQRRHGRLDQSEAGMRKILRRPVAAAPTEAGKLFAYLLEEAFGFDQCEGFRLECQRRDYRWLIVSGVSPCQIFGDYLVELIEGRLLTHLDKAIRERLIKRAFDIIEELAKSSDDYVDDEMKTGLFEEIVGVENDFTYRSIVNRLHKRSREEWDKYIPYFFNRPIS